MTIPDKNKEVLTTENSQTSGNKSSKKKSRLLKGEKLVLNTGNSLGSFEINRLDPLSIYQNVNYPDLEEIYQILLVAQSVLPGQFITSNQPERFNALHDRFNKYYGKKSFENANRDVRAWAVMKFFPFSAEKILKSRKWKIPYNLLRKMFPLIISEVKLP